MQKTLLYKILLIGLLTLLLLIPLSMIGALVNERQQRQEEVVADIARSYAGAQQLVGPVVALPWTRITVEERAGDKDQPPKRSETRESGVHYVFPSALEVRGGLAVDTKARGLFRARVYQWNGTLSGRVRLPAVSPLASLQANQRLEWGVPYLAVALDDPRGIIGSPELEWAGSRIPFEKGSGLHLQPRGLHASLPVWKPGEGQDLAFSFKLGLRGTERFALVPVADDNRIEMTSTWPHPSFGGRFLPDPESQHTGADGFRATWTISALAADGAQTLRAAEARNCQPNCGAALDALELRLVEPVAIYTLSDRALKYAYLFVVLTFAAFFVFEALKRLAIHPIQYLLVGLALALFFLLLISLSEHLAFALAYALAATACCGLIAVYLAAVLRRLSRGLFFGGGLGALFGALYVLLQSEDSALMLGSLLLFGLLAAAMISTRKIDWYALGAPVPTGESLEPTA
jgi:inner membrane protein